MLSSWLMQPSPCKTNDLAVVSFYIPSDIGNSQLITKTAAAVRHVAKAINNQKSDIDKILNVNYMSVCLTAQAFAGEMLGIKIEGSMCLVISMSGTIADRGQDAPGNSSRAGVVQLAQNLAMEFGRKRPD